MATLRRSVPLIAVYVALLATLYASAAAVLAWLPELRHSSASLVANALAIDLVVLAPAGYYLLLVRRGKWPWVGVVPIFLISLVLATSWIPAPHHQVLRLLHVLAAGLEAVLLALIGAKAYQGARAYREPAAGGDAYTAMRYAAGRVIPSPLAADVLAFELAMLYYGVFSWRQSPPNDDRSFSCHRRSAYGGVVIGLVLVMLAEALVVHGWVARYSVAGAWIITGLSLYGLLWLLGDWRAIVLRPTRATDEQLEIRVGMRYEANAPWDGVTSWRRLVGAQRLDNMMAPDKTALTAAALGSADFELQLRTSVDVRCVYGWVRQVKTIRLAVDDAERFEQLLASRIPATEFLELESPQ